MMPGAKVLDAPGAWYTGISLFPVGILSVNCLLLIVFKFQDLYTGYITVLELDHAGIYEAIQGAVAGQVVVPWKGREGPLNWSS